MVNNLKKTTLKGGIVPPGTETVVVKMIMYAFIALYGGFTLYLGLARVFESYQEYQSIILNNTIAMQNEIYNNNGLPVNTLTDILTEIQMKNMTAQETATYLNVYQENLIKFLKENPDLIEIQIHNLNELIKLISNIAKEASEISDKEALKEFINECKKYKKDAK